MKSQQVMKVCAELDKLKTRQAGIQARIRELERQKTELENAEIVELVRSVDASPRELAEFIRAYRAGGAPVLPESGEEESDRAENGSQTEDI